MKTVYIETSIPSFYHEARIEPEMVARRNWTRHWWRTCADKFHLVTSVGVIAELQEGKYATQSRAVALVSGLPRLEVVDDIADIIEVYVANKLMPNERLGDALHLALASFHKCDFLLTWNCRHIANANKFAHIRTINTRLGLFIPALVTPMELCSEDQR
ncbi:MAG: type II toxin-antitoxin system VapC family toxin [Planctomycetes bacterium]|nr:type II toxin-antitoxin system VapC family toxin [Planctomycetota bacterium]